MNRILLGVFVALTLTACGGGDGEDADEDAEAEEGDATDTGADGSEPGDAAAAGDAPTASEDATVAESDAGGAGTGISTEEQEYVDSFVSAFGEASLPDSGTNCIVEAYVQAIGIDRLREVITPEELAATPNPSPLELGIELTAADADVFYNHLSGCMDVRATFLSPEGQDPAVADCLTREIDDALLKRYVVAIFLLGNADTDPQLSTDMNDVFTTCTPTTPG